jgi:hypothetical protein
MLLFLAAPAAAFQFTLGKVQASLDTTLSYGLNWRIEDRDPDIVGIANGGNAYSVNGDDGNLNYDQNDYFSKVFKITSDLELKYQNFGLFLRGTAFYDFVNANGDGGERTEITDSDALDLVGKDAELLDAFIWWDFELTGMPGTLKVGDQVLSWGESTFIQNSINTINPVDVNKLRVPGAELKEALIPVGMVSASLAANEYVSFEGFYQYDWEETKVDPPGSYWSTNDFVGEGGNKVMLGFGDASDQGTFPAELTFLGVPRGKDREPEDDGQYGIALHVMAPGLNETEFGIFYMNYHSRLPIISAQTGTGAGQRAAGTIAAVTPGIITSVVANGGNPVPAITTYAPVIGATAATAIAGSAAQGFAASGIPGAQSAGGTVAKAFATDAYAETARYIIEYPEDIQLYGVSFNTQVDSIGVALQGEYSYRTDVPLQVDDVELLLAALTPINNPASNILADNQLGVFGVSTYIPGYVEKDMSQVQLTATKVFGPTIGADQFTLVGEVGFTHVHGMPSKGKLRLETPGTYVTGNSNQSNDPRGAHYNKPAEPSDAFADADSWGYRAVAKLDFNNAIGAVTLSPRVAWAHDVDGNTPGPGGNFLEDRKAVTYGIGADYQNTWSADLSYTDFFGAGRYNLINDRDFISFNVKYSF